jgi:hypothetical protein
LNNRSTQKQNKLKNLNRDEREREREREERERERESSPLAFLPKSEKIPVAMASDFQLLEGKITICNIRAIVRVH